METVEYGANMPYSSSEFSSPASNPSPSRANQLYLDIPKMSQKGLSSPLKSCSSGASVCRICHEGDIEECLVSPCHCRGTMALVHGKCLEKWLTTSNTSECEVCQFSFYAQKKNKEIRSANQSGRPVQEQIPTEFYWDLICLILLSPLCIICIYLCSLGSVAYLSRHKWEGFGLAFITAFIGVFYIIWVVATLKYYLNCIRTWRRAQRRDQRSENVA